MKKANEFLFLWIGDMYGVSFHDCLITAKRHSLRGNNFLFIKKDFHIKFYYRVHYLTKIYKW